MLVPRKRRMPSVQGEQPLHLFQLHFLDQGCVLPAHHDKHCPEFSEHDEHPLQLFHLHFFPQGLECIEHHGLQSPGAKVGLGVVGGSVVGAMVDDEGGVVVGSGVGGSIVLS